MTKPESSLAKDIQSRVLNLAEMKAKRHEWQEADLQVVFTNGCFDILHLGHLKTLSRAKAEGDRLIVGVNSDSSVRNLKGPTRPVNSEHDRAHLLAGLRCVDAVIVFSEQTPERVLAELKPDVHVKGGDYKIEDLPEARVVQSYGGRIAIIDLLPGRSTTSIIEKSKGS